MLTGGSGFELCQYARQRNKSSIFLISVKDDENTIVAGLERGADDYRTKLFRLNEFISRIKANLRHNNMWNHIKVYCLGNLVMDTNKRKGYKDDVEIFVRNIEYKLLEVFITNDFSFIETI